MKPVGRNVGEVFASDLTFEEQVERVVQSCFLRHHADLEKVIHAFTQIIGYGTLGFPWLRLKVTVHSQFGYLHRGIACLRKLGSFPFESREVFLYFSHFKITHQSGKLCSAYDDISSTLVCY